MIFANPNYLWLLLLVPALAAFLWWSWRTRQRLVRQFIHARLLASLSVGVSRAKEKVKLGLLLAAVACFVIALARPMWGFTMEEVKQRGLDIVVAIDTSRSMLAEDVRPSRLGRAKLAALDLLKLAKTDRLGLVAFAGSAFLQCPLTLDDEAFRQCLTALDVNIIPQGGTALTEAINAALTAYKDDSENHRVLVLFTDGEDHDGGAIDAAKAAAEKGMKIFIIGIGSADGELIRVPDEKGRPGFLRDNDGNIVKSRLNETLLRQIAGAAGGFYLNLRGVNTIETLYEKGLAPLPKGDFEAKMMRRYHERFYWPLALGIALLLVEMFLPDRPTSKRGEAKVTSPKEPLRQAVAVLLALLVPLVANASSSSAQRAYEAGKYEEALKEYQRLREKRPEDARLHFNTGASAYQAKRYEDAARAFFGAIASPDKSLQQSGFYNLGNTFFRAGAPLDTDRKMEAWETAVKLFDQAIKLNTQDKDAEFNRNFVKKKIEELKQEQQKQQQQQSQSGKQDKDDKQKQQKPDKQDQQQQKDSQKQNEKKDEQKQQGQQEPDKKQQGEQKQDQRGQGEQ
ncbi:MAG: VWA domain-containing protein, partial [Verrucomicrobia bacterium]|nr:VWA domain-containing protein [Verrucomicrobiota bacterium]